MAQSPYAFPHKTTANTDHWHKQDWNINPVTSVPSKLVAPQVDCRVVVGLVIWEPSLICLVWQDWGTQLFLKYFPLPPINFTIFGNRRKKFEFFFVISNPFEACYWFFFKTSLALLWNPNPFFLSCKSKLYFHDVFTNGLRTIKSWMFRVWLLP